MSKKNRALIVIDVQNEYITGNLLIEYPSTKISLPNIEKIINTAKTNHIPVIAIQHTAPENFPIFAKNSENWQLHDVVTNQQPDKIIHKQKASCFADTELKTWLDKHHINTLTIIGYMTHNCDISTIIQAQEMGYDVEFINDASGSLPYSNEAGSATAEEMHRAFTVVMQSNFAAVLSTNEWLKLFAEKKEPIRSNILLSYQQAKINVND